MFCQSLFTDGQARRREGKGAGGFCFAGLSPGDIYFVVHKSRFNSEFPTTLPFLYQP
jgi:hypothetical protein